MRKNPISSNACGPSDSRCRAFTLIELLVVIVILSILMAIVFSAVKGALDAATKTLAKNDVAQIATAITAFEAEYGRLPTNSTNVSGALLESLMGITNATNSDNPRTIVFLEVQAAKKGKGGTNSKGYVDPWTTNVAYAVAMDTNYDNHISVSTNGTASGSYDLVKKVGVWNVNTNSRRQVRSWD